MKRQKDNLEKQFEKAGLACKVLKEPIRAINVDIFQADIQRGFRGNKRMEYFRIYKGHETNIVAVANCDKEIKQLVLIVKEPKRTWTETEDLSPMEQRSLREIDREDWVNTLQTHIKVSRRKVISVHGNQGKPVSFTYEQSTLGNVRHYLLGVDERQLFIAELPKAATTIAQAHQMLKSDDVTFAEGKAKGKTVRQGEWFFVNATEQELQDIELALKTKKLHIIQDGNIGNLTGARRGGKAHVAREAVRFFGERLGHGFSVRRRGEVFVRGAVSHPDHATVRFHHWRKVIKNAEKEDDSNRGANGVYWID